MAVLVPFSTLLLVFEFNETLKLMQFKCTETYIFEKQTVGLHLLHVAAYKPAKLYKNRINLSLYNESLPVSRTKYPHL
jgi:hypothetical protein